jgi:hypothetical protein
VVPGTLISPLSGVRLVGNLEQLVALLRDHVREDDDEQDRARGASRSGDSQRASEQPARQAAVDDDGRARDVAGPVGREEAGDVAELLRRAPAPERNRLQVALRSGRRDRAARGGRVDAAGATQLTVTPCGPSSRASDLA